jgi:Tfp pilus assembly protein PilF
MRAAIILLCILSLILAIGTYQRNQTWKTAISLWEDVVKKSPNKARPHLNLGHAYEITGKNHEAVQQYRLAILLKKDYHEAYSNLGRLLAAKGYTARAIEIYNVGLLHSPADPTLLTNLGYEYQQIGDINKAISSYRQALTSSPNFSQALINLAFLKLDQNQQYECQTLLKKAEQQRKYSSEFYSSIADAYLVRQYPKKAIEYYKKAFLMSPPNAAQIQNNMGAAFLQDNNPEAALQHFILASTISPNDPNIQQNITNLKASLIKDQEKNISR